MDPRIDSELVIALALMAIGVLFIFRPEYMGIIIGGFLILMGVNSLTKSQGVLHGRRKKT